MKRVGRFEDLVAWQKARVLTQTVYTMTRERTFAKDIGLSSQVQRAAVSIMANIAEGFERNRSGEFHQFLSVAKGSCAEVRSHFRPLMIPDISTKTVLPKSWLRLRKWGGLSED